MSDPNELLLSAFDGHVVEEVRAALAAGADARTPIRGREPIYWLLEEYTRSEDLQECIRLLLDAGAQLDPLLAAVLLDDTQAISTTIKNDRIALDRRVSLRSAFTSLSGATLLHVAAEYGNHAAVRTLIDFGADVNAAADKNELGIGGHTPIFHTVNSNRNRSAPIMRTLVEAGASCNIRVDTISWGGGYPWETAFFDVTPVSYAQMGLMPQVHRSERDIYDNIDYLLRSSGRRGPSLDNVPNRYLLPKS
ncbi:MAG: ankyrin repeat domain-containing protein [Pyrinomonadaceae bacterium]